MTEVIRSDAAGKLKDACVAERIKKLGVDAPEPVVTMNDDDYRGSGRLVVSGWKFDHNGLKLEIEVSSAQNELEAREGTPDLVEVYMERPVNSETTVRVLTIAVVEPSTEANHALIKVTYSLDQLCKLFAIKPLPGSAEEKIGAIRAKYPEVGIGADWYKAEAKRFHYSGGAGARQGSGPIRLRPPTVQDLAATEAVRNSNWNLAEQLGEDRPVFKRFPTLLKKGKQVATALEVEAEYVVDPGQFNGIVRAMDGLVGNELLRKKLGILELVKEDKSTTDHYYDLSGFPLLKAGHVLRRRSAAEDPDGTWLLTVKGRRAGQPGRQIRLTAQADLNSAVAVNTGALQTFLADPDADNPVARTLRDALGDGYDKLIASAAPEELFRLTATRTRYKMTLADSVIVEFSADDSTAEAGGAPVRLYGFEFGLAHPGLNVAPGTVSSGGTMSGPEGSSKAPIGVHGSQAQPPAYSRTYHVPLDLDEVSLFTKADFVRFQQLVDEVIGAVLQFDRGALTIGGDKGRQAAKLLRIID